MAMDGIIAVGASQQYTDEQIALFLTSGSTPKGSWQADINSPTLTDGVGTLGWYYDVVTAGTQLGQSFLVGDRVMYNASNKWQRVATGVEDNNPIVVKFVDENDTHLPTTRPSGSALKNGDYVQVKSTATLPFTIDGILFDSYSDMAEWNGTAWQEKSYTAGQTNEIGVKNKSVESLSGTSDYQNEINIENVTQLKKVIQSISIDSDKLTFTKQDGTKYELSLDTEAANNSNLIENKALWKEVLKNTDCKLELDTTTSTKDQIHLLLKNNNGTAVVDQTLDLGDLLVLATKTQTLTNKTIDADDNTISDLTGTNFKVQTSADAKKTWVIQADGTWALGRAGSEVDNVTIEESSDKLQIKNAGVSTAKIADDAVTKAKIDDNAKVVFEEDTQTLKNKTLDVDNNTVSNIETDNLKTGVLQTSIRDKDTATDTSLASEKATRTELDKKINLKLTGATGSRSVVWKTNTDGELVAEEVPTPPSITLSCSPTSVVSGVATDITLTIKGTKGTLNLSKIEILQDRTIIETKTTDLDTQFTKVVSVSAATEFMVKIYDENNNTGSADALISATQPTYLGYFGTTTGGVTGVNLTGKAYSTSVTMSNDTIVYKYPKSLGELTSIMSGGDQYISFFTRTEETITTTAYYVYTQNAQTTVTNFPIAFS